MRKLNLEQFKSGESRKGYKYRYFVPSKINAEWSWESPVLSQFLEQTALKLGELNSFARLVPDIDLFIELHLTKEAVISSRIEGTRTEINEAMLPEAEVNPERRDDWQEVRNYVEALNYSIAEMKKLPLSCRLLRGAHQKLMQGVRGEGKLPGEFRKSQNWIGGLSIADAKFVPPSYELVADLMTDLENFLHNDDLGVPQIVRAAIAHYQFETIHPFLDGNGRIGRLLITLQLISAGILDKPLLCPSVFFDRDRNLYFDRLTEVRVKNDLFSWVQYFLVGVEQTASEATKALTEVLALKKSAEENIFQNFGKRSSSGINLLYHLFSTPTVTVDAVAQLCDVSFRPASELTKLMIKAGLLKEITGQSRNRVFVFEPYLRIFSDKKVAN